MKEIALTRGFSTVVDDDMFEELSQYKWAVNEVEPGRFYAVRTTRDHEENPRRKRLMHRGIVSASNGSLVDHRDGNGLNNQRSNLRLCTQSQNMANTRKRLGCTSQFLGVCKIKGRWIAQTCQNYRRIRIGSFDTEVEAAIAYDKKKRELFGEFASVNFPEEALR